MKSTKERMLRYTESLICGPIHGDILEILELFEDFGYITDEGKDVINFLKEEWGYE